MKLFLLLPLILLPVLSQAQGGLFKKRPTIKKSVDGQRSLKKDSVFVYTETRRLDTNLFFPKPPEIFGVRDTISRTPQFTLRACLTNLKSINDIQLTVNGEVQSIPAQTLAESSVCKGLQYSCPLTLPLLMNTISLEARNEGGASVHYVVVTIKP